MLSLDKRLLEYPIVALDTETSGAYPLDSQICEVAAVKFYEGKVIDTFQSLIKIDQKMPPEIEKIHGISDEMLMDAPRIEEKLPALVEFLDKSVIIGHHIQFDLGFLAVEIEKFEQRYPENLIFCTSLLSRALITESPNHRLQTLIGYLGLNQGAAHRALDDSKACLELHLRCMERLEDGSTLKDLQAVQDREILWEHYSIEKFCRLGFQTALVTAIKNQETCFINYKSPRNKEDNFRKVLPKGLVLNSKDSFLPAICYKDMKEKRFYLDKIQDLKMQNPYEP